VEDPVDPHLWKVAASWLWGLLLPVLGVIWALLRKEQARQEMRLSRLELEMRKAADKADVHDLGNLIKEMDRKSETRAEQLRDFTSTKISEVHQNSENKHNAYSAIKATLGLQDEEIAYIGDDEPDLSVLEKVGFSAAPCDAVEAVRKSVDYVCKRNGGRGAVREVVDLILRSRGNGRQ